MSTGAAEGRIRSASARFASYDTVTGLNAKGEKAPGFLPPGKRATQLEEANARRRAKEKAARVGIDRSQQAKDREAKKRAARGNTCVNGHPLTADNVSPVGNGVFNCIACRRARQGRVNEMRRRAYALLAEAA